MVLFEKFSQNEIRKFGRNLLLAKFGSERVKCSISVLIKDEYITMPPCKGQKIFNQVNSFNML